MNNDKEHTCDICGEIIGFIDPLSGVFDIRYSKNYENHSCKEWKTVGEERGEITNGRL